MPRTSHPARATLCAAVAGAMLLSAASAASRDRHARTGRRRARVGAGSSRRGLHPVAGRPANREHAHCARDDHPVRHGVHRSRVDAGSNATVWRKNGDTAYRPASTNKLITASNALSLLGPEKRFTTRIRSGAATTGHRQGVGDPSVTSAQLDRMAATTALWLSARKISSPGSTSTTTSSRRRPWRTAGGELRARLDRHGARPGPRPEGELRTPVRRPHDTSRSS